MRAPARRPGPASALVLAALVLCLGGCAREPERNLAPVMVERRAKVAPPAPAPAPGKKVPGAAPAGAARDNAARVAAAGKDNVLGLPAVPPVPAGELYNPAGKRNPFLPYLRVAKEGKAKDLQKVPPLQRADISEFRYVGILRTGKGVQALLETGDGKGYPVQVGTRLGREGGVVTAITAKEISIRETSTDPSGKTVVRETFIRNKNANAGGKQ